VALDPSKGRKNGLLFPSGGRLGRLHRLHPESIAIRIRIVLSRETNRPQMERERKTMSKKVLLAGIALVLALGVAPVQAGIDLNEVSAFLVFPGVAATSRGPVVETFLTITNTSTSSIIAHVAFINGNEFDRFGRYCYECDFDVPMSGLDTETLVLTRQGDITHILNIDTGASRSCSQFIGFVTVDVEDSTHSVLTDNILLGEEVVVDYTNGAALSVEAISVQGDVGDGDRFFEFDGKEYRKFPSVIGGDFLAPDYGGNGLHAALVLFTLAFDRQFPPLTDCSVIGFDAFEEQFSESIQFGCWTVRELESISPEFAYPWLGASFDEQEHGWFHLDCTVFGTGGNGVVDGGVHGAIAQYAETGTDLRRSATSPTLANAAAWARILYQSGTVGDSMTLRLEAPVGGGF